jgi:hypothetical protein
MYMRARGFERMKFFVRDGGGSEAERVSDTAGFAAGAGFSWGGLAGASTSVLCGMIIFL